VNFNFNSVTLQAALMDMEFSASYWEDTMTKGNLTPVDPSSPRFLFRANRFFRAMYFSMDFFSCPRFFKFFARYFRTALELNTISRETCRGSRRQETILPFFCKTPEAISTFIES